jgi:glycosyltransferase involved in cell wall biosynthesis
MRILFITSSAAAGGGPRHLLGWIEALHDRVRNDIEIYLAAPSEGYFSGPLKKLAVETFALPERSFSWTKMGALIRFAHKHRIELVHSFGRAGGVYGRLLGLSGFKVLHTPQGLISSGVSQLAYDTLERSFKPFTQLFVFGSDSEARQGRERFGAGSGVVLPPVVEAPQSVFGQIRHVSDEGDRPIVIGSIGRLVSHKRMHDLAAAVLGMPPKFHLHLYGDGEERASLDAVARGSAGRMQVRGLVDRWEALSEIDIFASWSISESFGIAVAEAMAVGLPCVLSNVPGHCDLADNGERAWLFDPDRVGDFARVVTRVISERDERDRKIELAKTAISELCGAKRVSQSLLDIYLKHI